MIFKWESEEEKLIKFMSIAPKKKMEWLAQMHKFLCKAFTKKQWQIYQRLREGRRN